MSWWPLWFCGMPYQNVYGPVLHHLVAGTALALHISAALAFHSVTALAYCLGPVTLFWMAYRFTGSRAVGFWSAALYSVISPAALLIPEIRYDIGGAFYLRRLHNIVVWGEQPHVAALALAPLALLSLDVALRKERPLDYAISAVVMAVLALTNVTGWVGFAMLLGAYVLAKPPAEWLPSILRAALVGLLAYGLAAPWIPPSTLKLISANSQWSLGSHFPITASRLLYLAAIVAAAAILARLRLPQFPKFALLLTFLSAALILPAFFWDIAILPQPKRFHLEFELGCCLAAGYGAARLKRAGVILACLCLAGLVLNHVHATELIQPIEIRNTTEYKEAIWFDQNMHGRRVFAPGSVSFWMNIFTDTPQLGGCCDQSEQHWQQRIARYVVYTGQNTGPLDAAISLLWLQAYGVHAIGVSGPGAGEFYKPFHNPGKFDGVLKELWRDGADVIYEVPQRSDSLAHVIRASQVVSRGPLNGLDVEPIEPFVAALNDPELPLATFAWTTRASAKITADMRPGDLLAVQVTFHPGWRARVNGSERRIDSDALGLMVIRPECAGPCLVDLIYDGGAEMKIARVTQFLSAVVCVILCLV